jgi:ubiquinone/menaquinone biosynthesis C-methylase UbiE
MSETKVYDVSQEHIDAEAELNRLHSVANQNWPKEARNLKEFGLKDGMSVLELGSGPGYFTELLAQLVPNGSITGLEIEPELIQRSLEYLQEKISSRYDPILGSVNEIPFPDNTFDFAIARLLFRHLPDKMSAAKEIFRVLKPGGKLVITEFDYEIPPISDPPVPEAKVIREKAMLAHQAIGGDPMIARKLWRILKVSGFKNFDLEVFAFHSGQQGIDWCYPHFDPNRALPLVREQLLSEEEFNTFRLAIEKFMAEEDPFFMWVISMACGEKT